MVRCSLASHTLQSLRERGSGEVAYNELFCWNAIIVFNAARAVRHIIALLAGHINIACACVISRRVQGVKAGANIDIEWFISNRAASHGVLSNVWL